MMAGGYSSISYSGGRSTDVYRCVDLKVSSIFMNFCVNNDVVIKDSLVFDSEKHFLKII